MKELPAGTLGNDIAKCLDDHQLRLVPNYESHDLKHVLLGFEMSPADEIRMQAFMLGNGNYTFPCFAILFFGILLLPELWPTFYNDFKAGRNALPISTFSIAEYQNETTQRLREKVMNKERKNQSVFGMRTVVKTASLAAVMAGIVGMFICLPFLFSSALEDLIGAGFPFIGGALLTTGGLISLSNLFKPVHQRNLVQQ